MPSYTFFFRQRSKKKKKFTMSVAPLIQLMSRGKQNDILNENPQITFWRYRHMKYTDFALEHINVTNGNGESSVALGPMTFDLPRSGDLVNDCFAVFRLSGIANVMDASSSAQLQVVGNYVIPTSKQGATMDANGMCCLMTPSISLIWAV